MSDNSPIVANEEWGDPPDPTVAEDPRDAVAIKQYDMETVVIGREANDEWLYTDMNPLPLERYR